MSPKFSVVIIAKNEEETLPRLGKSLEEFLRRGGEWIVLDTGSTDSTVEVAKKCGAKVTEVGTLFITVIDGDLAKKINKRFVVGGEEPVVKAGDKLFNYAAARNYAAKLASNDFCAMPDADEIYTSLDIDTLDTVISDKSVGQLSYEFVFSHDIYGKPVINFIHSKFYDRTKFQWNPECIVHEVLAPINGGAQVRSLPPNIIKLEHFQKPSDHRSTYLTGLSLDCLLSPKNDRNSHYLGREMVWTGRPKSAIKELSRHIDMHAWPAEEAQSYIYMGDAYGQTNQPSKQVDCYNQAFYIDSSRREALIRLARFYQHNNNPQASCCYAKASMEIPWNGFYANMRQHYEQEPHEILYWAYGWMGNIPEAKSHILQSLKYQPHNPQYIRDTVFYMSPLETFTSCLEQDIPFTFIKKGDGELACMAGETGANCDGHPYSPELGQKLKESFDYLADKAYVVDFQDQKRYNCLLHRTDNDLQSLKKFWMAVRESKKFKVFVGPDRLEDVGELLSVDAFIPIPEVNAFSEFDKTLSSLRQCVKTNGIFVFSAGMTSKVWIAELAKMNPTLTLIDAGSAFDPLFVGRTRTEQIGMDKVMELYPELTKEIEPKSTIPIIFFFVDNKFHVDRLNKLAHDTGAKFVMGVDLGNEGLAQGAQMFRNWGFDGEFVGVLPNIPADIETKIMSWMDSANYTGPFAVLANRDIDGSLSRMPEWVEVKEDFSFSDEEIQTIACVLQSGGSDVSTGGSAVAHPRCCVPGSAKKGRAFYVDSQYIDNDIPGYMGICELTWLYNTAKGKSHIAEIGSFRGRSTHALCMATKETGDVVSIDPCLHSPSGADTGPNQDTLSDITHNLNEFTNWRIVNKFSVDGAKEFPDNHFDMIFIDGDHSYNAVVTDIKTWLPKLVDGGILCGHDYKEDVPGVRQAVDELLPGFKMAKDNNQSSIWYIKKQESSPHIEVSTVIPRRIFTMWIGNKEMPELVKGCIETQKLPGYEHIILDNSNIYRCSRYVNEALEVNNFIKASDYLRFYHVWKDGGIFLDADMEILPGKNFDDMLNDPCFMGYERPETGWIANSGFGAVPGNKVFRRYLDCLDSNFRGDGDLNPFETGMKLLSEVIYQSYDYSKGHVNPEDLGIRMYPAEVFYPYNHSTGNVKVTDQTRVYHHYNSRKPTLPIGTVTVSDNTIPKRIFTFWMGGEMSEEIKHCIETQKIPGYEHIILDDSNRYRGSPYVEEALSVHNWVKMSDYLRFYHVWRDGGIYLDADVEILNGKLMDDLLHHESFMNDDWGGLAGNYAFGGVAGNSLFKSFIDYADTNFRGTGTAMWETSVRLLTDFINFGDGFHPAWKNEIYLCPPETFCPYNCHTKKMELRDYTIGHHHGTASWMPLVSVCIPTLGRPEKLQRCLDAVSHEMWPHEVIVEEDSFTNRQGCPKTLKKAVERSRGEYVCFLGNDTIPQLGFLKNAMEVMRASFPDGVGLVGFTDPKWPDQPSVPHWVASKKLIPLLDGELFHAGYFHVGCDNELAARCKKMGKLAIAKDAIVEHDHPMHSGWKDIDQVVSLAWNEADIKHDRDLLAQRSKELGFEIL